MRPVRAGARVHAPIIDRRDEVVPGRKMPRLVRRLLLSDSDEGSRQAPSAGGIGQLRRVPPA